MSFIAFILKGIFKIIVLCVLVVGIVFTYTQYARTYGIVKFKNGGYLMFDAAENSYILEQSKIILRIATGASDYRSRVSVIDDRCDERCILEEKSLGMTAVDTQPFNVVRSSCSGGKSVNIPTTGKRALACVVNGSTYTSLSVLYEVAPGKVASIVMGSSRQVASHDPNYINNNQRYITEIINNSEYRESIWPTFGWLGNFIPPQGASQ